jgi:hypothetical protein
VVEVAAATGWGLGELLALTEGELDLWRQAAAEIRKEIGG